MYHAKAVWLSGSAVLQPPAQGWHQYVLQTAGKDADFRSPIAQRVLQHLHHPESLPQSYAWHEQPLSLFHTTQDYLAPFPGGTANTAGILPFQLLRLI